MELLQNSGLENLIMERRVFISTTQLVVMINRIRTHFIERHPVLNHFHDVSYILLNELLRRILSIRLIFSFKQLCIFSLMREK